MIKTLRGRGMTVEQGNQNALNRRGWETIVSMSVVLGLSMCMSECPMWLPDSGSPLHREDIAFM